MNKFLQVASERYPKDLEPSLIHPLSRTDAEIISEIIGLFKELKQTSVVSTLNQFKYLKDSEIYDKLLDCHTQLVLEHEDEASDDDDTPLPADGKKSKKSGLQLLFTRNWIFFKDYRLDLNRIHGYEKHDEYKVGQGMVYQIIINELPHTTSVRVTTTHKVIEYTDMERRDMDFAMLDEYFINFPGITFINERNE
jgi:hypothetical protein